MPTPRLPYPAVQKLIWWRMSTIARWYIKRVLFKWGEPPERAVTADEREVGTGVPAPHAPVVKVGPRVH